MSRVEVFVGDQSNLQAVTTIAADQAASGLTQVQNVPKSPVLGKILNTAHVVDTYNISSDDSEIMGINQITNEPTDANQATVAAQHNMAQQINQTVCDKDAVTPVEATRLTEYRTYVWSIGTTVSARNRSIE